MMRPLPAALAWRRLEHATGCPANPRWQPDKRRFIVGAMNTQEEFAGKLQATVARLIGPPGEIIGLRRLTGGATKSTYAFSAKVGSETLPLVMQLSSQRASAKGEPLA